MRRFLFIVPPTCRSVLPSYSWLMSGRGFTDSRVGFCGPTRLFYCAFIFAQSQVAHFTLTFPHTYTGSADLSEGHSAAPRQGANPTRRFFMRLPNFVRLSPTDDDHWLG